VPDSILERVFTAAARSELVQAVAQLRGDGGLAFSLSSTRLRSLSTEEIRGLESLGNTAEDWSRIGVAEDFDWTRVRHSEFQGSVILGRFSGHRSIEEGTDLPCGIFHSTVANCIIGHDVLIRDVKLLANYMVGPGAVLFDCGSITSAARTTFGNGIAISLGIESGGREVALFAEIDVEIAAAVARRRSWSANMFPKLSARAGSSKAKRSSGTRPEFATSTWEVMLAWTARRSSPTARC
jgi:hypothetical protein